MNYFKIVYSILYWIQCESRNVDEHKDKSIMAKYCNGIIKNECDMSNEDVEVFNLLVEKYLGNVLSKNKTSDDEYVYDEEKIPKSRYLS